MRALAPIGRILFSLIFIVSGFNHLQNRAAMAAYAESLGLPFPDFTMVASGLIILTGGILVLIGFATRVGGALLAAFLISAAFTAHAFWNIDDPQAAQMQMAHFMKNVSMAGCALLLMYFGPGPISIDRLAERRSHAGEVSVPMRERTAQP